MGKIYEKEQELLALIGAEPTGFTHIEIQKLMFLLARSGEAMEPYDFVPWELGCYSPTLARDLRRLEEHGFVIKTGAGRPEKKWHLTKAGEKRLACELFTPRRIARFVRKTPLRGKDLVRDVYRRHPYWAINSVAATMLLESDQEALDAIEASRPHSPVPLASIGYEGRSFENYLDALVRSQTTVLCDVRRNPLSRKYGFSRAILEHACRTLGIKYIHYADLGIPSDQRRDLVCQEDYDALFDWYEERILPGRRADVDEIAGFVLNGECVAVTCFEANPAQCHRTRVLNAVSSRCGKRVKLI